MSLSSNSNFSLSAPPRKDNKSVFQAPWEARAFAIVNQLANAQEYSWSEWTEQFADEISAAEQEPTDTSSYYERWVRACEKLLIAKGILDPRAVDQRIEELLIEQRTAVGHEHLDHKHSDR
ncbi:MAG: nitrile hydratase accessory protein [Leptolyngbyaceae cyanobacterium MO_188.B28]|nr:nitrile hydratase accessory protein [Leptolyngbyaceae cyanobacterium MO_188.B28]